MGTMRGDTLVKLNRGPLGDNWRYKSYIYVIDLLSMCRFEYILYIIDIHVYGVVEYRLTAANCHYNSLDNNNNPLGEYP